MIFSCVSFSLPNDKNHYGELDISMAFSNVLSITVGHKIDQDERSKV